MYRSFGFLTPRCYSNWDCDCDCDPCCDQEKYYYRTCGSCCKKNHHFKRRRKCKTHCSKCDCCHTPNYQSNCCYQNPCCYPNQYCCPTNYCCKCPSINDLCCYIGQKVILCVDGCQTKVIICEVCGCNVRVCDCRSGCVVCINISSISQVIPCC